MKETKAKVILVDPFYISRDQDPNSYRIKALKHLPKYISTVHAMSRKYRTRLVKTHEVFHALLKYYSPDHFCCPGSVYPHAAGHLVITHARLKVMGW